MQIVSRRTFSCFLLLSYRYGQVLKCKVFEVVEQCAKEEAVRIFVQFTTITAATKAIKVR
jgi:hypothetical protein